MSTVHTFLEAAQAADRAHAFRLLGPATQARLTVAAAKASTLAGRRRVEPIELVAVGWFAPRFAAVDVRELGREGNVATVEVRGAHGERQDVQCVRGPKGWLVELP